MPSREKPNNRLENNKTDTKPYKFEKELKILSN